MKGREDASDFIKVISQASVLGRYPTNFSSGGNIISVLPL